MLVVNNAVIKKGIEIPELVFEVLPGDTGIKVLAIDKVKYTDWLALNNNIIVTFTNGELTAFNYGVYVGDEIIVDSGVGYTVSGLYGVLSQHTEY